MLKVTASHSNVQLEDVCRKFLKGTGKVVIVEAKRSLEERREFGIVMMKLGHLSSREYHEIRMFLLVTLGKDVKWLIGAPLIHIRIYRKLLAPKSDYFHGDMSFETKRADKKTMEAKILPFWLHMKPLDQASDELAEIINSSRFVSASDISFGRDNMLLSSTNIDKDADTLSYMTRQLCQADGNTGQKIRLLAQIKGGPAESHTNVLQFKKAPAGLARALKLDEGQLMENPAYTYLQALYEDEVVHLAIELKLKSGKTTTVCCGFYFECLDSPDVPLAKRKDELFSSEMDLPGITVYDKEYLASSGLDMKISDIDELRLLRYADTNCPVAIAKVDSTGDVLSWSSLSNRSDLSEYEDAEVLMCRPRRDIGLDGSDSKMLNTLVGGMGATATEHCAKCLHVRKRGEMSRLLSVDDALREGVHSHHACYEIYKETEDKNQSHCISSEPIFRIHPMKATGGTMHQWGGVAEKMIKMLKGRLRGCEEDGTLDNAAACLLQRFQNDISDTDDEVKRLRRATNSSLPKKAEQLRQGIKAEETKLKNMKEGKTRARTTAAREMTTIANIESLKTQLSTAEAELKKKGENLRFFIDYHEALQRGIDELDEFSPSKKIKRSSFLLLLLEDALIKGLGVDLKGYFGGDTLIGRHAYIVLQRWPEAYEYFENHVTELSGHLYDIDDILLEMKSISKCILPLSAIATMMEYQGFMGPYQPLLQKCVDMLRDALIEHYPEGSPALKKHCIVAHAIQILEFYGFIGAANEQGAENGHGEI